MSSISLARRPCAGVGVGLEVDVHLDGDGTGHRGAFAERLQRRSEAEFVQRARAQVGDQAAHLGDRPVHLFDPLAQQAVDLLGIAAPSGGEQDAQAGEALQGLVVQLAGPAPALALGRGDAVPGPLLGDRLRRGHRGGGAGGEGARAPPRPRR